MSEKKDGWRVSGEDGRGRVLGWVIEAQRATGCRHLGKNCSGIYRMEQPSVLQVAEKSFMVEVRLL